jgi:hypothetical protein
MEERWLCTHRQTVGFWKGYKRGVKIRWKRTIWGREWIVYYRLLLQRMDPREGNNIKVKDVTKYYPIAHASAKRIERLFTVLNVHKK